MPVLQERIVAHHVGARGFGVALNCPAKLAKHLIHVVYEADEQCAKEMIAENKDENFHVLPYCLGGSNQRAKLYICKNPYFSSNLEPNEAYAKYYCEIHLNGAVDGVDLQGECYDVDYGGDMRITRVADVAVRTLDEVLESGAVPRGCNPDFLSLDTQGSELGILVGGEKAFSEHCLALATEVEFHELYKDQPLFSDIFQFAHRHGFHFAGFTYLQEFSSYRLPIGARDKGFVGFGDALFLRRIESVRAMAKSEDERYLALLKLAFISLNFGYLEYAVQSADAAEAMAPSRSLRDRLAEQDCYKAVLALRAAVRELPPHYPYQERTPMTDEVKRLLARAAEQKSQIAAPEIADAAPPAPPPPSVVEQQTKAPRLRHLILSDPIAACRTAMTYLLQATLKVGYSEAHGDEKQGVTMPEAPREAPTPEPVNQPSQSDPSPQMTPVEAVLEEYGYSWLADSVRRRRKSAESSVAGKMYR